MFHGSRVLSIRLPGGRRPKERAWEFLNIRGATGFKPGFHNYRTGFLAWLATSTILAYELWQQWQRIIIRGDTCPSCDRARIAYRQRMEGRQRSMDPAGSVD